MNGWLVGQMADEQSRMLFLLFQLGKDRYALDASRVVEVAPLLALKRLPQAPKGVAGIFNYRGRPVPAVDLCEMTVGRPASEQLSTRIIIVNFRHDNGADHLLGLIAENATETLRKSIDDFVEPGVKVGAAPYLGAVFMDARGVIQRINEEKLLPGALRRLLFAENPEVE
jgi:chemotaxis-related protein WspB